MIKYDVIIIGAGCSGLSLAYRLLNTNKKVCVIEKFSKSKRVPKTWSYWNVYDHPFKNLETNRLSELFVRSDSMVKLIVQTIHITLLTHSILINIFLIRLAILKILIFYLILISLI